MRPLKARLIGRSLWIHGADFVTSVQVAAVGGTPDITRGCLIRIEPATQDPESVFENNLALRVPRLPPAEGVTFTQLGPGRSPAPEEGYRNQKKE